MPFQKKSLHLPQFLPIASPRGVIVGIIPATNPTSTAIYKVLISVKARNALVLSPHHRATSYTNETAHVLREAAVEEGLPEDAISCMTTTTRDSTDVLMRHEKTAAILATGGAGLVRATYSSGKPAFGVGSGNVPVFVERTANLEKAVQDILTGKCFDNGTICSSEQSVIVTYDLWQVHTNSIPADGGVLSFSWGGFSYLNGNGQASDELKDGYGNPANKGQATAARTGSLAGRVRLEELEAGKINHALAIVVNCVSDERPVGVAHRDQQPLEGKARWCSELKPANGGHPLLNPDAPPLGARLQLRMSYQEIEDLGTKYQVPKWKRTMLHAMSEYGMIVTDTGADGLFAIETESGNMYTSVGYPEDKWREFGRKNWDCYPRNPTNGKCDPAADYVGKLYTDAVNPDKIGNEGAWVNEVWSKLQVVKPCYSLSPGSEPSDPNCP